MRVNIAGPDKGFNAIQTARRYYHLFQLFTQFAFQRQRFCVFKSIQTNIDERIGRHLPSTGQRNRLA